MKRIILIENCPVIGTIIANMFGEAGFEVRWLREYHTALSYLDTLESTDALSVKAIIFDFRLDGDETSIPLVHLFRDMGPRHMIANSCNIESNQLLRTAGCTVTNPNRRKVAVVQFTQETLRKDG